MHVFRQIAAFAQTEVLTPWLPGMGEDSVLIPAIAAGASQPGLTCLSRWQLDSGRVEPLRTLPLRVQNRFVTAAAVPAGCLLLGDRNLMLVPLESGPMRSIPSDTYDPFFALRVCPNKSVLLLLRYEEAVLYSCEDLRELQTVYVSENKCTAEFITERRLALHEWTREGNLYSSSFYHLDAAAPPGQNLTFERQIEYQDAWLARCMLEREGLIWSFEVQEGQALGGLDTVRLRVLDPESGAVEEEYPLLSSVSLQSCAIEGAFAYFLVRRWPEVGLDPESHPYLGMENPFTVLRFSCASGRLETVGKLDWPFRQGPRPRFRHISDASFRLPWLILKDEMNQIAVFHLTNWEP